MNSWPKVAVEDFTEVITGGTPSTAIKEYWEGGNVPWLNSGELNKGVITKAENFITESGLKHSSARLMPEDTVLIALTGATTGISAVLKIKASGNQSVTGILPSKKHDAHFLLQYLRSIRSKILSDSYGGAQKHISQAYVKKMLVPLPPLQEQHRIADILDRADALREKRRTTLTQLDTLTQSIFMEMFGDLKTNSKKWEIIRLGDIIEDLTDYHANGSYEILRNHVRLLDEPNYALMIRTTDLENNEFSKGVKYITQEAYEFLKKSKVFGGEIIINKIGSAGNVYLAPQLNRPVSLGMNSFLLRISKAADSNFLYHLLTSDFGKNMIKAKVRGAVTKTITKDALRGLEIIFPPFPLQQEFVRRVSAIEKLGTLYTASLNKIKDLFASLQYRAFRGEL